MVLQPKVATRRSQLLKLADAAGRVVKPGKRPRAKRINTADIPAEVMEAIRRDYEIKGLSFHQLSARYGVSVGWIHTRKQEQGWTRNLDAAVARARREASVPPAPEPITKDPCEDLSGLETETPRLQRVERVEVDRQEIAIQAFAREQLRIEDKHRQELAELDPLMREAVAKRDATLNAFLNTMVKTIAWKQQAERRAWRIDMPARPGFVPAEEARGLIDYDTVSTEVLEQLEHALKTIDAMPREATSHDAIDAPGEEGVGGADRAQSVDGADGVNP